MVYAKMNLKTFVYSNYSSSYFGMIELLVIFFKYSIICVLTCIKNQKKASTTATAVYFTRFSYVLICFSMTSTRMQSKSQQKKQSRFFLNSSSCAAKKNCLVSIIRNAGPQVTASKN